MVKLKVLAPRSVVSRAANAFRIAAQTLCRSHSASGTYYRRMQVKMGAPKAITATAHKLARVFFIAFGLLVRILLTLALMLMSNAIESG